MPRDIRHFGLVTAVVFVCAVALQAQNRTTIFVGPQVRDGFIDIDAGIRDSIRDIQQQITDVGLFTLVKEQEHATLVLIVLGRGIVIDGSVGFGAVNNGIGTGVVVPNTTPTLTTVLRVGNYERRMLSDGGTWTKAADMVMKDVTAWWDANWESVVAMKSQKK